MICPRCASNQTDNVKFCTFCGANLEAVREVLAPRDPDKKFNWNGHVGRRDVSFRGDCGTTETAKLNVARASRLRSNVTTRSRPV
jgi:hypothetical protein